MPWANGRGTTLEIAAHPPGDQWTWRLSLATVTQDGPFSTIPGVDRFLVVADGAGMDLAVDGEVHRLNRFESLAFAGEAATEGALVDGPVRDLNLMLRRDRNVRGELRVERFGRGAPVPSGGAVAIVVLDGAVAVSTPSPGFPGTPVRERAGRFDAFVIDRANGANGANDERAHTYARLGPAVTAVADSVVALAFVR